ncbi:MAG: 1-acyl-sn-glycerol-3-phosphate acyltransferase [Candidatus Dormibacteraeota bacterium]|nr:1-acyl-sn-glycerol-3-phosphate acyltransferase [Candidatus Dormibacteraeota bacterium]
MIYAGLRWCMRSLVRVYLGPRFSLEDGDLIPRSGGLLVCSNHRGTIDPPLVPAFLPRRDSWSVAKSEWFSKPHLAALLRAYQAFPIVRHSADRKALDRAFEIIRGGHVLVIYPEGTRVPAGGMRPAEPGAGFIARISGVTVLPVALVGTEECLPRGAHWPRRVDVEMRIGPPLRVRGRRPDGRRVQNQEAVDAIMLAVAECLPESLRGAYAEVAVLRARLAGVTEPVAVTEPA